MCQTRNHSDSVKMANIQPFRPYSPSQITQYLDRISLPTPLRPSPTSTPDLKFLAALQRYHLASIPFENLALHYTQSRQDQISLDPQAVFDKFITCCRGGYCMEQTLFFAYMLRGLGFKFYSAGARVRKRENGVLVGNFMGWTLVVNIATLESQQERQRYMVDIGFGGGGPTKPLPLTDGWVARNLGTQEISLRYENIGSNADLGAEAVGI